MEGCLATLSKIKVPFCLVRQSYVAQTGIELCIVKDAMKLLVFLPLPPECWDYWHVPPTTPSCIWSLGLNSEFCVCQESTQSTELCSQLQNLYSINKKEGIEKTHPTADRLDSWLRARTSFYLSSTLVFFQCS